MKTLDDSERPDRAILKQQKAQEIAQKQAEDLLQAATKQGLDAAAARKRASQLLIFQPQDMVPGLGPARSSWTRFSQRRRNRRRDGGNIARLRCLRFAGGGNRNRRQPLTRSALGWKKNSRTSAPNILVVTEDGRTLRPRQGGP